MSRHFHIGARGFETLEDRRMLAVVIGESTFDPQTYASNMNSLLDGNVMGYAHAVNYDGVDNAAFDAGGLARTAADDPERDFGVTTKIEVASVTKMITAVALIQLLDALPGSLDDALDRPLQDFMPSDWDPGASVGFITMRHLLRHTSGLQEGDPSDNDPSNDNNGVNINFNMFNNNNWANLETLLEADIPASNGLPFLDPEYAFPRWARSYNNVNTTILAKVVMPALILPTQDFSADKLEDIGITPDKVDGYTGQIYSDYVIANVFEPSSIFAVSMDIDEGSTNNAMSYAGPTDAAPGAAMVDRLETGGAFGWKLSARQLARFLDGMQNNDAILSPEARQFMTDERLGWELPKTDASEQAIIARFGPLFGHGGRQTASAGGQRFRSQIMVFPGGVEAATVVNSDNAADPTGDIEDAMRVAYLNAWPAITFEGSLDDDTFEIDVNTSGPQDSLEITLNGNVVFSQWVDTLQSLTINGLGGNDVFRVLALPDEIELVLNGGTGDDEFYVDSVANGALVTLNGEAGNDTFSASDTPRNLESVNLITFHGGADEDTVMLNDHINNNPFAHAHIYFISSKQLHRQAGAPGFIYDVDLFFSDVESITFDASLAPFDDFVEVLGVRGSLTVNTYDGNDSIDVAGLTRNLDDVNGLTVNAGFGSDSITIFDQKSPWQGPKFQTYQVLDAEVSRFAQDAASPLLVDVSVQMSGIETLDLFTSDNDDVVAIANMPTFAGTIDAGEGDDTIYTTSGNLEDVDDLIIIGGKGEDVVMLDDGSNPYGVPADGSFPPGIPTANIYEVSTSRVRRDGSGTPPNYSVPTDIAIFYEGVEHLRLTSGDQGDEIYISGGGAWTTDVILGAGNDVVHASPLEQNIEFVDGLTVHGAAGEDALILYDAHNPYSHVLSNQYEVAAGHVSRYRDVNGPGQTHLPPGTDPADAVGVLVQMVSVELLDLTAGGEDDVIEVISSTSKATTIDANNGDDMIVTTSGDLADVAGLFVQSNVGEDTLVLDDANNDYVGTTAGNYYLTSGQVVRGIHAPAAVRYSGVEHLRLLSGDQVDRIEASSGGSLTTEITAGAGDDEILVAPASMDLQLIPGLSVDGGDDQDRVVLHDANNPYINNIGHVYTIDQQQVRRDGGVSGQPQTIVPVAVAYVNVEALELHTGAESEIVNIAGTGSEASLTVRSNGAADRFNVSGDDFSALYLYGGNPTHPPGDVLNLEAPPGAVTGLLPSSFAVGQAVIDDMMIHYWEIETVNSTFPVPSAAGDAFGDFDGNGIVNGDDLTHPLLGFDARFGTTLDGANFLAWQLNLGQAPPSESNLIDSSAHGLDNLQLSPTVGLTPSLAYSDTLINQAVRIVGPDHASFVPICPVNTSRPGGLLDTELVPRTRPDLLAEPSQQSKGGDSSSGANASRHYFGSATTAKQRDRSTIDAIDLIFALDESDFNGLAISLPDVRRR